MYRDVIIQPGLIVIKYILRSNWSVLWSDDLYVLKTEHQKRCIRKIEKARILDSAVIQL